MQEMLKKGEDLRCYDFFKPADFPDNVEFIAGDLLDPVKLKKACKGVDTVFHFMDIKRRGRQKRKYMKNVNITGTKNLLYAAEKHNVKKFFFLSSFAVYGKTDTIPIRQDDRKKPATPYGKDKLAAENICWNFTEKKNLPITIFRPALISGPGVKDPVINITLYMALAMGDDNMIYMSGDGATRFQLLHIEDAVKGFIAAYESNISDGKVYNLGSDNVITQMEQIVHLKEKARLDCRVKHVSMLKAKLMSLLSGPLELNYFTRDHIFSLFNNLVLDCQRAKEDLKWHPVKNNIDILMDTIEWYKETKL